jgi:hypothetical protein
MPYRRFLGKLPRGAYDTQTIRPVAKGQRFGCPRRQPARECHFTMERRLLGDSHTHERAVTSIPNQRQSPERTNGAQ